MDVEFERDSEDFIRDMWTGFIASRRGRTAKGEAVLAAVASWDLERGGPPFVDLPIVPEPTFLDDVDLVFDGESEPGIVTRQMMEEVATGKVQR